MVKIILLGQPHNRHLEQFFIENLSKHYCLTAFSDNGVLSVGEGKSLMLLSLPKLAYCHSDQCINILAPHFKLLDPLPAGTTVIAASDDERQLKALAKVQIPVITCGLSSKDTFTFSSKEEESAVVALMRSIKSVYGHTVEPMEVPITFPPKTDDFTLLSYTASLILTETISSQNNDLKQEFTSYKTNTSANNTTANANEKEIKEC